MRFTYKNETVVLSGPSTEHLIKILNKTQNFYEIELLEYISQLELGGTYLDIGANIGNHTVFFAMFCNSTEVIAFEPMPLTHSLLQKNIRLNKLGRAVDIRKQAVGASTSTISMIKGPAGNVTGMAKVTPGNGNIELVKLDSIQYKKPVTVIKIDVEGYEPDVLAGSTKLILKDKPHIFIEAHDKAAKDELDKILNHLGYYDIAVFNVTPTYHYKHLNLLERLRRFFFYK